MNIHFFVLIRLSDLVFRFTLLQVSLIVVLVNNSQHIWLKICQFAYVLTDLYDPFLPKLLFHEELVDLVLALVSLTRMMPFILLAIFEYVC